MKKIITLNLKIHVALTFCLSLLFFITLYYSLKNSLTILTIVAASIYGFSLFMVGLTIGPGDKENKFYELERGFYYHLSTFIICNLFTLIFFFLIPSSTYLLIFGIVFVIWFIALLIHYYYTRPNKAEELKRKMFE